MKTIALDFDGTLLDSRKRHMVVMDDILLKYGIAVETSNLIDFKRNGKNNVDFLVANGVDYNTATNIQREWILNIEKEEYLAYDVLYPDTIDMLKSYSIDNKLVLITSRKNTSGVQKQVADLKLDEYLHDIYVVPTVGDVALSKAKILIDINASKMVGDTSTDYRAACIAGIEFVFHENGFHNKKTTMENK